jgi:hypothetical protein
LVRILVVFVGLITLTSVLPATAQEQPTRPDGFSHSLEGSALHLRWDASSDNGYIHGYDIYRNGSYFTSVPTPELTTTEIAGEWQAVAVDDSGNYSSKSETYVTTDEPVSEASEPDRESVESVEPTNDADGSPSTPVNLRASRQGGELVLLWDASSAASGIHGYDVYLGNEYLTSVSGTEMRPAQANSQYRVVAVDRDGNYSSKSEWLTTATEEPTAQEPTTEEPIPEEATTEEPTAGPVPSVPENLRLEIRQTDGVRILNWDASVDDKGVAGYNIYLDGTYHDTVHHETTFDRGPFNSGAIYSVTAFDGDDNYSSESDQVVITLGPLGLDVADPDSPEVAQIPTAPTSLWSSEVDGVLQLAWGFSQDNSGIGGYTVYRANGTRVATTEGPVVNRYRGPELTYGESYYVTAFDTTGNESQRSTLFEISSPISGTPYNAYKEVGDRVTAPVDYDLEEEILTQLSLLHTEFSPAYADDHWESERSQKNQRAYNRRILSAIIGSDHRLMDDFCCGSTIRFGVTWLFHLQLMAEPGSPPKTSVPSEIEFHETWTEASLLARLHYLGIDAGDWALASPFYDAYMANVNNVNAYDAAQADFFFNLGFAIVVGVITGGVATGLAGSTLVGGAVGGAASGATLASLNGGDAEDILAGAFVGALGGLGTSGVALLTGLSPYLVKGSVGALQAWDGYGDLSVDVLVELVPDLEAMFPEGLANVAFADAAEAASGELEAIFGRVRAEEILRFAEKGVPLIASELTLISALVPDADLDAEASRVFAHHIDLMFGDQSDMVAAVGNHVRSVANNSAAAGNAYQWALPPIMGAVDAGLSDVVADYLTAAGVGSRDDIVRDIAETVREVRLDGVTTGLADEVVRRLASEWQLDLTASAQGTLVEVG